MAVAGPGQLNLDETPNWGSRSVDCFEKIEQIGEGTYGQVYMAKEKATGEIVALKKVRMDNEKEGFPITAIREIKILKKLKHANVIKLKEIVTSRGDKMENDFLGPEKEDGAKPVDDNKFKGSIYMVFEYMDHDLTGLSDRPGMRFTVPQIKCYMKQLLTGLHYCHINQVLHRDIKGSNLLIDNNGNLKLADFGLARSFTNDNNGQPLTNRVITLWYRPPELLMGSTRYSPAVDMWSVGCIFAELLHGKPILPGRTEIEQLTKIFELCGSPDESIWPGVSKLTYFHKFKPERPMKRRVKDVFKHFDRNALELLERMLTLDPAQRVTAKDALDGEYFWVDPLPCLPSSLPKYEASHEFQTKKKRQQQRQQQEELAKRQKTQHQQSHHQRLPVAQGGHGPRSAPSQSSHGPPPSIPSGPGHHYGAGARGPGGPPGRHLNQGRPPAGGNPGGYGANRGGPAGPYGIPPPQGGGYTAPPGMPGQAGRAPGTYGAGYPQGGGYGGGRGLAMGSGRGQQYGMPNSGVLPQGPGNFGGQQYMQQQPPNSYIDVDGQYARANHSGFGAPPPGSPHRGDYRQQQQQQR
ncbi:hypothetical protein Mapa_002469 [Marchantia paleacea]|nr:hypothetical protein Mapa_002469 [Marchantia paleacea]